MTTSIAQRLSAVAAVLAAAAALPAGAQAARAHNALDPAFGSHGRVEHWVDGDASQGMWLSPGAAWPAGGNRIVVQRVQDGDSFAPLRVTATGALDTSFGTGGTLESYAPTRLPDGAWVGQTSQGVPTLTDPDGHVVPTSAAFGSALSALHAPSDAGKYVGLADGDVLELVATQPPGATGATTSAATVGRDGTVKRAGVVVGGGGALSPDFTWPQFAAGDGAIVSTRSGVARLRADGTLDPRWGVRLARISGGGVTSIAPWGDGGVAFLGTDGDRDVLFLVDRAGRVVLRTTVAEHVAGHLSDDLAIRTLSAVLTTDAHGRVLLARVAADRGSITVRRYAGTRLDPSFGTHGVVQLRARHHVDVGALVVQPDGRIVVVGKLQKYGEVWGLGNSMVPSAGWEEHGTVLWRLLAR